MVRDIFIAVVVYYIINALSISKIHTEISVDSSQYLAVYDTLQYVIYCKRMLVRVEVVDYKTMEVLVLGPQSL